MTEPTDAPDPLELEATQGNMDALAANVYGIREALDAIQVATTTQLDAIERRVLALERNLGGPFDQLGADLRAAVNQAHEACGRNDARIVELEKLAKRVGELERWRKAGG